MKQAPVRPELAFALDVPGMAEARNMVALLAPAVGVFKVGLELFISEGPDAVRLIHDAGRECFLDLKLHDIPATMARAVEAAARLGVAYLTLHALSGLDGLAHASRAARGSGLKLLAVTVLTSMDSDALKQIGFGDSAEELVLRLAERAAEAGVTGFVTSAHECHSLRARLGQEPLLVVPGIRPEGASAGDQRRLATPAWAIAQGADLLVVGRPIRDADDPLRAAQDILTAMRRACESPAEAP
ncbi:MAG: orotidine-5'-phosphate decarboxylase [Myxococcales bacterium]|nr:orotidine-5'-phosphate decarboxylase [Myxococcales bacterium]MCB9708100.1 orotidine-5'-phosphate decarboxylase [Myxococcales bacterium]